VIAKPGWGGRVPPNIFTWGWLLSVFFFPQLFHDTKSIFCHQVQFFYFFLPCEVSDKKHGVDENLSSQIIWLHSFNNLEFLLVIL